MSNNLPFLNLLVWLCTTEGLYSRHLMKIDYQMKEYNQEKCKVTVSYHFKTH